MQPFWITKVYDKINLENFGSMIYEHRQVLPTSLLNARKTNIVVLILPYMITHLAAMAHLI